MQETMRNMVLKTTMFGPAQSYDKNPNKRDFPFWQIRVKLESNRA